MHPPAGDPVHAVPTAHSQVFTAPYTTCCNIHHMRTLITLDWLRRDVLMSVCPSSGGTVSSAVPYAEAWRQTAADVILFEIEDSVPAVKKDAVRQHVVEVVGRGNFAPHQRKMVTVNRLDTKWGHDDLVALATADVNGVVLAKCESPEDVRAASDILDAAGAPPDMEIWAMIETPRGATLQCLVTC